MCFTIYVYCVSIDPFEFNTLAGCDKLPKIDVLREPFVVYKVLYGLILEGFYQMGKPSPVSECPSR